MHMLYLSSLSAPGSGHTRWVHVGPAGPNYKKAGETLGAGLGVSIGNLVQGWEDGRTNIQNEGREENTTFLWTTSDLS